MIVYVLDAVLAENQSPMRLRLAVVLLDDLLIGLRRLVEGAFSKVDDTLLTDAFFASNFLLQKVTKTADFPRKSAVLWLRKRDLNPRPPG